MISAESKKKNWFHWVVDHDPDCASPAYREVMMPEENCLLDVLVEFRKDVGGIFPDFETLAHLAVPYSVRAFDVHVEFWDEMATPDWRERRDSIICSILSFQAATTKPDPSGPWLQVVYPSFTYEIIKGPHGEERKVFFPEEERDRLADFTKEYFGE